MSYQTSNRRKPQSRRRSIGRTLGAALLLVVLACLPLVSTASAASSPAYYNSAIEQTWARTDQPVASGAVHRTWMWGPHPDTPALLEPYAESPGGQRVVQYFDKSRMEITHPSGDQSSQWYVTNGLLAEELITGNMQLGDNTFKQYAPAQVNVAGDPNDANGPTYASFTALMKYQAIPSGWVITQTVNRAGQVGSDPSLKSQNVTAKDVGALTHHTVASVFWDFMNSSGLVWQNGKTTQAKLFSNPFYATGYPLTEPYWATVKVGGKSTLVLIQVFERRVLTYTPSNPSGWKVESGNVGQHYYTWRYVDLGQKPVVAPAAGVAVTASISNPSPGDGGDETVTGTITNNGEPLTGVPMTATWHYKTTTDSCSGTSNASGVASCVRGIGHPTVGYSVVIDVSFTWKGHAYTTTTSFTPR